MRFVAPLFEPTPSAVAIDLSALHPSWHRRAACRGMTTLFFVEGHGAGTYAEARRLCASCPVQLECAAEGESLPGPMGSFGFRAGRSPGRRRLAVTSAPLAVG